VSPWKRRARSAKDKPGAEEIRWAYRLFLDREPENERVLEQPFPGTEMLRRAFLSSEEFREKNRDLTFDFPCWVIKETKYGFRLWVALNELAICRPVLMDVYEDAEAKFVTSLVRPGDHAIDAGANIGFFTMLLAATVGPGGSVRAFEPLEYLFDALGRSTGENHFEARVESHRLALSDAHGTAHLRHAPATANFGGAHLVAAGETPHGHEDVAVLTAPLDSFLDDRRVAFIKMDVEGAEPKVVAGAAKLLERDHPVILAELHNAQLRAVSGISATEFIAHMHELGYTCRHLHEAHRGTKLTTYNEDRPINVIFEPR
jgi:FkbM family methyltransferase